MDRSGDTVADIIIGTSQSKQLLAFVLLNNLLAAVAGLMLAIHKANRTIKLLM
jgi:hypothetical protein